jgi:hypothetical protein
MFKQNLSVTLITPPMANTFSEWNALGRTVMDSAVLDIEISSDYDGQMWLEIGAGPCGSQIILVPKILIDNSPERIRLPIDLLNGTSLWARVLCDKHTDRDHYVVIQL